MCSSDLVNGGQGMGDGPRDAAENRGGPQQFGGLHGADQVVELALDGRQVAEDLAAVASRTE